MRLKAWSYFCLCFFFFFQAEDGIRDYKVTGVQTCALPSGAGSRERENAQVAVRRVDPADLVRPEQRHPDRAVGGEIGRASCRGRVEISVGAGSLKKKKRNEVGGA